MLLEKFSTRISRSLFLLFILIFLSACAREKTALISLNSHEIKAEIADESGERYRGLSDRAEICSDCGLLFLWNEKNIRNFSMRDMRFNLDIIWIDGEEIIGLVENAPADGGGSVKIYSSPAPADKVLELPAGAAGRYNLKTGDSVKIKYVSAE